MPVEEFIDEPPTFAPLREEYANLLDALDKCGSVVISGPDDFAGILTPMDVIRYQERVTGEFLDLQQVEHAVRWLIRRSVPDDLDLQAVIDTGLSEKYVDKARPRNLEDMSFDDYVCIVRDGRTYDRFSHAFGENRCLAAYKLEQARDIRNIVFHFRRPLDDPERLTLRQLRIWLLRCRHKVDARKEAAR